MSRVTRQITRCDTDPCPLAHLPPELLSVIFEHSTGLDLACWALTNADWARAINPALAEFWAKHTAMCAALANAASFEELEAVPKVCASSTMAATRIYHPADASLPFVTIDTFRDEASFAELQQRLVVADNNYEYSFCYPGKQAIEEADATDAAARLAAAKATFRIMPRPFVNYSQIGEEALAIATTVRMRPPELMEVAKSWLAAAPGEHQAHEWSPTLVGAALKKNLHRTKWDNGRLLGVLSMAVKVATDEEVAEATAVDPVINWLPSERQHRVASLLRPRNEPENARFWFDMLFCHLDDEFPNFKFRYDHDDDMIKTFCGAIDARVLAKLIEITVEEEENEADYFNDNRDDDDDPLTAAEVHVLTVDLLRAWVAARNFPADLRSPEEQNAFLGMLTSLHHGIKREISLEALNWVLGCSQLPTMARRICSAFA